MSQIAFDGNFWAMVGAVASGVSAVIASCALLASIGAIKAARDIDANNAARIQDRERRDAIPLALAIQSEIHRAVGFCERLRELFDELPKGEADANVEERASDICKEVRDDRERVLTSVLRDNINELGCFSAEAGKHIAAALTMSDIIYRQLRLSDEHIEKRPIDILMSLVNLGINVRPAFDRADEALSAVTGLPSLKAAPELQKAGNDMPGRAVRK